MFIAFEGPDNAGKSTAAAALDCAGQPDYNATKKMHAQNVADWNGDASSDPMPHTYDRIDWLTHLVYRLAYPTRDWDDDRPRTVFAMPDTHLVLKLHHPVMVDLIEDLDDGIPAGKLAAVNEMYYHYINFLMELNKVKEYALFKSITIVEVANNPQDGSYTQSVIDHDSPAFDFGTAAAKVVRTDEDLLEFLRYVDQHIG